MLIQGLQVVGPPEAAPEFEPTLQQGKAAGSSAVHRLRAANHEAREEWMRKIRQATQTHCALPVPEAASVADLAVQMQAFQTLMVQKLDQLAQAIPPSSAQPAQSNGGSTDNSGGCALRAQRSPLLRRTEDSGREGGGGR